MHYDQVVSVEHKQPVRLVHQWMRELCSASAWLELRNYAHNDIRPENLLLDGKDHLKLADFGSAGQYRSILEGERPPYVRWHSVEVGDEDNSLGTVGPSSEQFAVGSTIYCVIEGHEVYGNEWFSEEYLVEVVERLQQKKFPALNRSAVSNIIHDCWHGSFDTIKQLLATVIALEEGKKQVAKATPAAVLYTQQQRICRRLVKNGILDRIPKPVPLSLTS